MAKMLAANHVAELRRLATAAAASKRRGAEFECSPVQFKLVERGCLQVWYSDGALCSLTKKGRTMIKGVR